MNHSKVFQQQAPAPQQNYQTVIEAKKRWFSLELKEICGFGGEEDMKIRRLRSCGTKRL